jgi:hypothetical protein
MIGYERMSKREGTNSCSVKVMSTRSAITDTIFAYFVASGAASFFLFINDIICNRYHSLNVDFLFVFCGLVYEIIFMRLC